MIKVRDIKGILGIFSRMVFLQEEFVMGWDDLLSSIGGALGLWLGLFQSGHFLFNQLAG